ncbi:hypothetical protein BVY03_02285 [bacterium K02(2017)]|nr:hypothetical protein BVY03_02285 [bacterium K02(2017)]
MASYRFCRPDDVSLLVKAINNCYPVHYSKESKESRLWDEVLFKKYMHEWDLWPGCCVVATHDGEPISVLIAAKRDKNVRLMVVATQPNFVREGHASHLLDSLRQKLNILAPGTCIEALIPDQRQDLQAFFMSQNYELNQSYLDYNIVSDQLIDDSNQNLLCQKIDVAELEEIAFFQNRDHISWEQKARSMIKGAKNINALSIPSVDGFIAYVLYEQGANAKQADILGFGSDVEQAKPLLYTKLFLELKKLGYQTACIRRLNKKDDDQVLLKEIGFKETQEYHLYCNQ